MTYKILYVDDVGKQIQKLKSSDTIQAKVMKCIIYIQCPNEVPLIQEVLDLFSS